MGDYDFPDTVGRTLVYGEPYMVTKQLKTASGVKPGSLVTEDTTIGEAKACTASTPVMGVVVWENTYEYFKDGHTYDTAFSDDDQVTVAVSSVGCIMKLRVATPANLTAGDYVCNWTGGEVMGPVLPADLGVWLKIPFTKNASEADTSFDLTSGMMVLDVATEITTAVASGTIDVGMLSTEASGDADGFLDAQDCATAYHYAVTNKVDATAGDINLGALLVEVDIKDATGTPVYVSIPTVYKCDGTTVSVSYTTSAHAIAGNILLNIYTPYLQIVGRAVEAIDASSAATTGLIQSLL